MRCATVLLACGWLLFAPYTEDGKSWDATQPLSKWKHIGSFDSAKECTDHKTAALLALREEKDIQAFSLSRCLPSDVISLPSK